MIQNSFGPAIAFEPKYPDTQHEIHASHSQLGMPLLHSESTRLGLQDLIGNWF